MTERPPIACPSGYAPAYAVGFASPDDTFSIVNEARPLPVALAGEAPSPLVGTTSASTVAGPFDAIAGRVVSVALTGEWEGTVRLLRSTDSGSTRSPLLVGGVPWAEYTDSGCEQAWSETETGASYYLDVTLTAGTLGYRVSQ